MIGNIPTINEDALNEASRHEAIILLYPNVIIIRDNIAYDSQENIVVYDNNLVDAKVLELKNQRNAEEQTKENAKVSAMAKLTALGLTNDEVSSLLGIKL